MVPPDEIHLRNQAALEELAQTLEWSVGEFHLFLARCSYVSVRSRLIKQLQGMCPISLLVVTLNPQTQSLYSTLEAAIATAQQAPDAIIVTGFEAVPNLKELLSAADASREEFRKSFSLPILLWLDDDQFQVLKNQAPNFESWAAVDIPRFEIATGEVLNSLRQGVGAVLAAAYAPDQRKISPAIRQISTLGDLRRAELPRALQTLRDRQVALPSDLEANLHLIQGIDAAEAAREMADTSHHETALTHLEGCIDYWHQDMEHAAAGVGFVSASPLSSAFDRAIAHFRTCIAHWRGRLLGDGGGAQGAVPSREDGVGQGMLCPNDEYAALPVALFYLGRHWFKHVDKARMAGDPEHSQSDWHQARIPLEECIALFDAADQEHMVAKVIRRLEGVLRRLEQWDALDALARRAIALHERYPTPDWLAIDHGFLAEAALGRQDWATAKAHAQQALGIIAALPEADQWGEGLYRSLVARAETGLGNPSEAIAQLETARDLGDRRHPTIYCDILAQLRSLYWERGEYLKAFKLKQARLEVEKVAGIRAFVGAGRLGAQAALLTDA
ncbi:MAG: tetratricopeptide repeat protein, partial [Elainellaceae cyanobacterium]